MTLHDIVKQVEKFTADNSPAILTGIGVAGTVLTGVLAYRAGKRIGLDMNAGHYEPLLEGKEPEVYDTRKFVATYWPEFVPPVAIGALSVTAIIGANRIGTRRAAAVAAAYSLSEKAFSEYRDKVVEKFGEKKQQVMYDEIAQKRVDADPISTKEVIITGNGDVMCYDTLTGRYFLSSMEKIKAAVNEVNKQIITYDYASLTEFYDKLGLSATAFSEEVGWRMDELMEVHFSTVISEDGKPCLAIQYTTQPVRNYFRIH